MSKGTRELNKDETREALLKSAHRLFCKNEFNSISIDQISKEAEVTKGAFYHHFESKYEIFEKSFISQAKRIEDALLQVPTSEDPIESAHLKAFAFLDFVNQERRNLIPLDEVITVLGWRRWKEIDISFTMKFIVQSLSQLQKNGFLKNVSISILADAIHGLLSNLAMTVASNPKDTKGLTEARLVIENFLNSILVLKKEINSRTGRSVKPDFR